MDAANLLTKKKADEADVIFALDSYVKRVLQGNYSQEPSKIICLDIEDKYRRNDPELHEILTTKLTATPI